MDFDPKPKRLSRRKFLHQVIGTGLAVSTGPFLPVISGQAEAETLGPKAVPPRTPAIGPTPALPAKTSWQGPMGIERIARFVPLGYQSPQAETDDTLQWVQVDLGAVRRLDTVKLFPMVADDGSGEGFPIRFRVEVSAEPLFSTPIVLADCTGSDFPDPYDAVSIFPASGVPACFVRITVTRLRDRQFLLSKLEAWSGGVDAAQRRPISDSVQGDLGKTRLTRAPRRQAEGVITDNPGNVIPASQWRPVANQAHTPTSGVRLGDGVFLTAMQTNIDYLLSSFSVAELLRPFQERAGKPVPPDLRPPVGFWDTDLPGSNAGRFLMGSGNTLRWIDHPELHARMNATVDGIADCVRPDGYMMAYPEETIFYSERGAYTRSWVTHGLIEAGYAGHPRAFPLLRGFYDWFDHCPYLPELLRRGGQGVQGMIPSTRVYFTPIGKPKDIQVIQRFYQEDYWMEQLARRDPQAIWLYPYDHPHNYLITSLEPYLDQYRATGAKKYWDAAQGGWELYHDNWEHVGGSIAICEGDSYPPKSYYLHKHTGEFCGSVFWVRYNQRFHLLSPHEEKYVAEIEKSIYNVGLANQAKDGSLRYHTNLVGTKDASTAHNTCCEGQGTRLLGSLPEYIYSTDTDGLFVNLFHASSIAWAHGGQTVTLTMTTQFPFQSAVHLSMSVPHPVRAKIHVRVPAWATQQVDFQINGKHAVAGKPGTYVTLDQTWKTGDTITFMLPMGFRLTRHVGFELEYSQERFALEYGPILMALLSENADEYLALSPEELVSQLSPLSDQPLHFAVAGHPDHHYQPYWQVQEEAFTCFPVIGTSEPMTTEPTDPGNLALARLGAKATSDSEYAHEPGCTSIVIDDNFALAGDLSHRWHSSLGTPHPHWIQVTLPQSVRLARIVICFADPAGHPTDFEGNVWVDGHEKTVFRERGYADPFHYRASITPVVTDTFRFLIQSSANPAYPNAAQVSRIELYSS